ncbi:TPA: hydrolase TatD [Patescibacteria group bacterium]|nr:MAG: Deoxyribonuclease, TatD Mg-dependent [Parcubacteria group bacterium GW2011_GWA2_46_39]HBV33452.1 hydrolase TatD [Patescibacteria group bacterium]
MIDTHCHLNFKAFKDDADEVIKRAHDAGVTRIINVGSQWDTSARGVSMAEEREGLYAAIALHPIHLYEQEVDEEETHFTTRAEVFDYDKYKKLALESKKVVAIGECGLDYYHFPKGENIEEVKKKQADSFQQHIDLATELNLPLIIHCREAYDDLFQILNEAVKAGKLPGRGVNHCFLGTREQAKKFLDLGFYLSFTGIITFKNASPELLEVVKETPLDKIMVETDAPYLAPHPYRGKRNEPAYVVEVANKIAELKEVDFKIVLDMTTKNAEYLFTI